MKVDETSRYLFSLSGDDGIRMFIDGNSVVDDWHDGTARLHTLQMTLEAGRVYPIVVEYFQSGGGCSVDFKVNRIDPQGMKRIKQELQQYDLVLVCEGFDKNLEAEGGDRTFELPKVREAVLQAVAQSGILYSFGFGLSYTTFRIENLELRMENSDSDASSDRHPHYFVLHFLTFPTPTTDYQGVS